MNPKSEKIELYKFFMFVIPNDESGIRRSIRLTFPNDSTEINNIRYYKEEARLQMEYLENPYYMVKDGLKLDFWTERYHEFDNKLQKELIKKGKDDKDNKDNTITKYGDIRFDLHNRTLEIGLLKNERKIINIDKIQLSYKNLKKHTPTAIALLYCIVKEANNGNFTIKNSLYDYEKTIGEYRLGVGINNEKLQSDFTTYLSSARTLLELSQSKYEITANTRRSSATFGLKPISNKSS